MGDTKPRHAPNLPAELWAKVFTYIEELPENLGSWHPSKQQKNQAQLQLVCKQFREVYASHPWLVQQLCLPLTLSSTSIPSLLAWLRQNTSIRRLQSRCNPRIQEVVLAGIVLREACMQEVDLCHISEYSISLLGVFQSLETCRLRCSTGEWEYLNLAPLGVLPKLNHLVLHGKFCGLHHLARLTRLECEQADVSDVQVFAPRLQHLEVHDSALFGMHPQGLSACTTLTRLVLRQAFLKGTTPEAHINKALTVVPANIELLTQLHTLHLSSYADFIRLSTFQWVSSLTSLQDLSISFHRSQVRMLQHVSPLTNLTCLAVVGLSVNDRPLVSLDIEWQRLQALQELSICTVRAELGHVPAGLLLLQHLRQISFAGSVVHGANRYFAALIQQFAGVRPQVNLIYNSTFTELQQ